MRLATYRLGAERLVAEQGSPAAEELICVRAVSKQFSQGRKGSVDALGQIELTVGRGEFVTLLGPSGCGKSTLLRIIAGLTSASTGEVTIAGRPITKPSREIGLMFQRPVLLPWRTVEENILLPAEIAGGRRSHRDRARSLLEMAGISTFMKARPHELSGGMQQRVALCRTLLMDPVALLMDEPFGALDALTREQMGLALVQMWESARKTVLFVTHSISEALLLGDRVLVMSARPGEILADIPVTLPRPRGVETEAAPGFQETASELRSLLGIGSPSREPQSA